MRSNTYSRRGGSVRRRAKKFWSVTQVVAAGMAALLFFPPAGAQPEDDVFVNFEAPGGTRTLACEFTGQAALPDTTVFCRMRIGNGGPVDGSFSIWIDEHSLSVDKCPDVGEPGVQDDFDFDTGECLNGFETREPVPPSDPRWEEFVGFWAFSVTTRPVITRAVPSEHDVAYDDRFEEICPQQSIEAYDGGDTDTDTSQMCALGVIRGLQTTRRETDRAEPAYERQYFLGMTLRDNGLDQTEYRGWDLHFDLIIRMQVPADETCPTSTVNGICAVPIYERP